MPHWTWKQAVADQVLELVRRKLSPRFTIDEIYAQGPVFQELFPSNRHIKEKIRQHLQRLRDEHFLIFHGGGNYELNLQFNELSSDAAAPLPTGSLVPSVTQVLRSVRLRDTLLAIEIKRRYGYVCQVCRAPVIISLTRRYAEGHHLQPLGRPHCGPDVPGNIIVLCPNHHVMFDRGALTINPESMTICHRVPQAMEMTRLHVEPWHVPNPQFLRYHHDMIFTSQS